MNPAEVVYRIANAAKDLFNEVSIDNAIKAADICRKFLPDFKKVFESIRTHWIALYVDAENVTYFDSFGLEHIPR